MQPEECMTYTREMKKILIEHTSVGFVPAHPNYIVSLLGTFHVEGLEVMLTIILRLPANSHTAILHCTTRLTGIANTVLQ